MYASSVLKAHLGQRRNTNYQACPVSLRPGQNAGCSAAKERNSKARLPDSRARSASARGFLCTSTSCWVSGINLSVKSESSMRDADGALPEQQWPWMGQRMLPALRQDKARGVIPENSLQRVEPDAVAYSFAVSLVMDSCLRGLTGRLGVSD